MILGIVVVFILIGVWVYVNLREVHGKVQVMLDELDKEG